MKKVVAFFVILFLSIQLASCSEARTAKEIMSEFLKIYGAEGIVYSPSCREGEDGYIDNELFFKIYVLERERPKDFAVFLSSHTSFRSECGVFICEDAAERIEIEAMCLERMSLLGGESSFISRSGNIVFYSTMSDKERTEKIWRRVIG